MFRNATMRLIAAHLVLVAVSTALVLGSLYWRIGGVIDTEQQAVVEAELRGLADDFARGGIPALAAGIGQRMANPPDRDAIYLLVDADGRRIAGNLADWPPTVAPGGGWTTLDLYRTDRARPTEISALARQPPERRAPARRPRRRRARRLRPHPLARAPLGARRHRRPRRSPPAGSSRGWCSGRIAEIDGAARAIMAGALDRRVGLRGTGDEFDQLAGTLNAMLDRIETLVRDLRTVTDSLAHDLRSPLGRLVRHLEAAADEDAPAETRRTRIDQALREAEGVLSTATSLLDISRIDAGIGAEQFTAVDLGRLAADVAELYEAAAEERELTLACTAAPGLVVRGHDQLLALALSNLVDNALKYAPAGSAITVAAARDGGRPALIVGDRGPGIPEADRARALGRFVRLDPSRGRRRLGLASSRRAGRPEPRRHPAPASASRSSPPWRGCTAPSSSSPTTPPASRHAALPGITCPVAEAAATDDTGSRSRALGVHSPLTLTFAIQSGSETSPFAPSPRRILSTTSWPEITSPTTVYWPFRNVAVVEHDEELAVGRIRILRPRHAHGAASRRACPRTPPAGPAGSTRRCPARPSGKAALVPNSTSPVCAMKPSITRWKTTPS